ncbi:hypothetical protein ACFFOS_04300 [Nocardioides kongjuensis]|uniref:Uncharacterized protein n=1 Tax=Nocardioides kongjuensis TaxID=349522 RepID=A0A852RI32_9ACTN|nr:hypothetical protein [Nocardioides kongjuensis]NYD28996.1 hypothetical protein [Nocardioides kongjuensis]
MLSVIGLSAAPLLSSAGVAVADTWSHADATGDVLDLALFDGDVTGTTPAPDRAEGDIQAVVVKHTRRDVRVRTAMRALPAARGWVTVGHVVTPRGRYEARAIWLVKGGRVLVLVRKPGRKETVRRCDGLRGVYDRSAATVAMRIPRSCLGNPRWVRVNVSVYDWNGDSSTLADDGMDATGWEQQVLSPKVRRG